MFNKYICYLNYFFGAFSPILSDNTLEEQKNGRRARSKTNEYIKKEDWNECHLIVKGNTLIHMINKHVMSIVVDNDIANRKNEGILGVQVHVGPPMTIEYRNIRIMKY